MAGADLRVGQSSIVPPRPAVFSQPLSVRGCWSISPAWTGLVL